MYIPKYTTYGQIKNYIMIHYSDSHHFSDYSSLIHEMDEQNLFYTWEPEYPEYLGVEFSLSNSEFNSFSSEIPLNITDFLAETHPAQDYNAPFLSDRDISCILHMPYSEESLHSHEYYEITFVYKGTCCQHFGNEKRLFNTGNLVIITPGSPHNHIVLPDSIVIGILVKRKVFDDIIISLLADDDLVSSFFRHALYDNSSNYLNLHSIDQPPYRKNIGDIFYESTNTRKYNRACSLGFFTLLMACTLRRYSNSLNLYKEDVIAESQNDFLFILEYMQKNYQTVTLSSLAETFHYTPAHLSKLFKKNIQQNFSDALRDLKMKKALEYLVNPSIKISDVAELAGYDSIDHFSRTFKKCFGLSPLKYRTQLLNPNHASGKASPS